MREVVVIAVPILIELVGIGLFIACLAIWAAVGSCSI